MGGFTYFCTIIINPNSNTFKTFAMKKQIFGLMALILCACAAFTACSDDDDDEDNTNSKLVGLWQSTHAFEWDEWEDGEYNPEAWQEDAGGRVEFKADGMVVIYDYHNGAWIKDNEGSYKVSGNKLILGEGNPQDNEITIDELNNETLIMSEKGYDYGGTFIVRTKYRRIS